MSIFLLLSNDFMELLHTSIAYLCFSDDFTYGFLMISGGTEVNSFIQKQDLETISK